MDDFVKVLTHTLAMRRNEAIDIFNQIDKNGLNYITFGMIFICLILSLLLFYLYFIFIMQNFRKQKNS